jgi:hypothetical protein
VVEVRKAIALCALAGITATVVAAQPPPVDTELLEFLGSLDNEEEGLREYLELRPVKVVNKTPENASPPVQPPDLKQVKAK